jgi:signal peptidase I
MPDQKDDPESVTPAPEPLAIGPRQSARAGWRAILAWARDLTVSVMIAIVLIVFIYQPVKVEGTSMAPSLKDQERIFINKFTYRFGLGDIRRGDTVVFWYPLDPSKSYIKRVIGIPGDLVRIEAGQVFVNGQALVEDYVVDHDRVSWPISPAPLTDRQVPPGVYFVLGDNRGSSSDSRSWGYVPRDAIYGKAVFAYWPLGAMGIVR